MNGSFIVNKLTADWKLEVKSCTRCDLAFVPNKATQGRSKMPPRSRSLLAKASASDHALLQRSAHVVLLVFLKALRPLLVNFLSWSWKVVTVDTKLSFPIEITHNETFVGKYRKLWKNKKRQMNTPHMAVATFSSAQKLCQSARKDSQKKESREEVDFWQLSPDCRLICTFLRQKNILPAVTTILGGFPSPIWLRRRLLDGNSYKDGFSGFWQEKQHQKKQVLERGHLRFSA